MYLKTLIVSFGIFILLDFLWIGFAMNKFYTRELSEIAKKKGKKLKPNLIPAIIVYILLAMAISFFVIPLTQNTLQTILFGGLMGLIIYGVYDLTNFSLLKGFSIKMTIVDLVWGIFSCAIVSILTKVILF